VADIATRTGYTLVMKTLIACLSILVFCLTALPAQADDWDEVMLALFKGEHKKKVELARPFAERGHEEAQILLGYSYEYGQGVPKDYKKAVYWYRLPAERGNDAAQNYLGIMYFLGRGVTKDDKESVKWFRRSAEQGYNAAQFNLGAAYANGHGVAQDNVLAHKWMNICGTNGELNGTQNRLSLELRMTPDQITKARKLANEWMEKHPIK
jgi:TPR repeat protein